MGDPIWASHNGLGVVNFDGNDAYYSSNEWGAGQSFTIFSIARYTHSTDRFRVISDRITNWVHGFQGGHMNKWYFNGWLTDISNGSDTKFHLHVSSMNDADQGNTFFDGNRVGSENGNGANNNTYLPRQIQFGGYVTNREYSKCEVAEFIAFNNVLDSSDRAAVEGYLANKWGISHQLPISHPNRDIMAGIGSGLSAEISFSSPTQSYPIPVSVTFKKAGSNHAVSGFTSSDLNVTGATVSSLTGSGASYIANLTPSTSPSRITVKLTEGSVYSSSTGEKNQRRVKEILFRPPVMKESDLALFFPLGEEENATTVYDWGTHGLTGEVVGNPERYSGRTGSAFRFDGSADKLIKIENHRAMWMNKYTLNLWMRYEVGTTTFAAIVNRDG